VTGVAWTPVVVIVLLTLAVSMVVTALVPHRRKPKRTGQQ
jgi:hypothetical protein